MYPSAFVPPPGFDENSECELQKCSKKKMSNNLVIKIWIIYNNNGVEKESPEKAGMREGMRARILLLYVDK